MLRERPTHRAIRLNARRKAHLILRGLHCIALHRASRCIALYCTASPCKQLASTEPTRLGESAQHTHILTHTMDTIPVHVRQSRAALGIGIGAGNLEDTTDTTQKGTQIPTLVQVAHYGHHLVGQRQGHAQRGEVKGAHHRRQDAAGRGQRHSVGHSVRNAGDAGAGWRRLEEERGTGPQAGTAFHAAHYDATGRSLWCCAEWGATREQTKRANGEKKKN